MLAELPQPKVFIVHTLFAEIMNTYGDEDVFDEQIADLRTSNVYEFMDEKDVIAISSHLDEIIENSRTNAQIRSRAWRTLMALPASCSQINANLWSLKKPGGVNSEHCLQGIGRDLRPPF